MGWVIAPLAGAVLGALLGFGGWKMAVVTFLVLVAAVLVLFVLGRLAERGRR